MEDEAIYNVKRIRAVKIEDDNYYQKHSNTPAIDVPIDDMRYLLKLFFNKAAVNMGKESYDAPDAAVESILEFLYKNFKVLPIMYVGMAIIRGSLGQYGPGRLVPNTIYKWLTEITIEYDRTKKHQNLDTPLPVSDFDLEKYPVGRAINRKIEWYKKGLLDMRDWDKVPLKELAEREGKGLHSVPELFGIKNNKI